MAKCTTKRLWSILLASALALMLPHGAWAAGSDGQFSAWAEQGCIGDPIGDGPTPNTDLVRFCWRDAPEQERIFWMFQRNPPLSQNTLVYFFVFLDMNGNGSYTDPEDRKVVVYYKPAKDDSEVTVEVLTGSGSAVASYSGDWGESNKEGGSRAEISVSFADLGLAPHQMIRMSAGAGQNASGTPDLDRLPDGGDITWSPVPVLGWGLLAAFVAAAIGVIWYRRGRFVWRSTSPSAS